jgi:glycosyltransferase involved in cell wall biosynthesis
MAEPVPLVFMGLLGLDSHNAEEARLVARLAERGHLVLYLAPLGVRDPSPRHWLAGVRRLSRGSRPSQSIRGVHSIALRVLPGRHLVPVAWLNRRLVRWQLRRGLRGLTSEKPVLWLRLPTPEIVDQLANLPTKGVVYECIDNYSAYPHYQPRELRLLARYERRLAAQADLIVTLSQAVAARFGDASHKTHVVPLGADLALFDGGIDDVPADLAALPSPRLGLVGGLDERVDFELLHALAMAEPAWSIVLIGPVRDQAGLQRLAHLPNVHLLGRRPFACVPAYLSGLDVCLIPYRRTTWTDGAFPAKLHEYLAAGRPVVATDLPGLATYAAAIDLAHDVPQFIDACRRAADECEPVAVVRRRAVARAHSLDARCQTIDDLLGSLPARRTA